MPTNILPSGIGALFQLGEGMEKGFAQYAAWLFNDLMYAGEILRVFQAHARRGKDLPVRTR